MEACAGLQTNISCDALLGYPNQTSDQEKINKIRLGLYRVCFRDLSEGNQSLAPQSNDYILNYSLARTNRSIAV
jgi:hypothetical protein